MNTNHRRRLQAAAALGWMMLLPFAARAEDWPQWRGPNRDGVWKETGILQTFPTNGLRIKWRAAVGYGFSSPVVAQGRVFVTDSQLDRPHLRERVLCFDEATGKPLWTFSQEATFPDWAFTPGQEQGPNGTAIVQGGRVYAPGPLGHRLFCLSASKGELIWQKDLVKEYQVEETSSLASSPLLDGDRLILLPGGKPDACVVALDRSTGKEVWRALNEPAAPSSPVLIRVGGARQLIVWTTQSVTSLNPRTGQPYWREGFRSSSMDAVATPVFSNHRLLIGGLMLRLDADKPGASVVWPEAISRRVLSSTSTPLLLGDHVFSATSSGLLTCWEAVAGKQVWETDKATDRAYKSSTSIHLTVNGDSVLLFNDRGELIRARLTAQGYSEMSRAAVVTPTYPFSGRKVAWAAPAYANRHIFARSDKELVCASLAEKP